MPITPIVGTSIKSPDIQPPDLTGPLAAKRAKMSQDKPILVDSGVGGAMAGMKVDGDVKEFGAIECLPIGDKAREQIITYTSQMVARGLISEERDSVIIACNTASTSRDEACDNLTDFILRQDADPDKAIFPKDSKEMARIHELSGEIKSAEAKGGDEAKYQVLKSKVHEIINPTSQEAASRAAAAFFPESGQGKDVFSIVVDSTAGTAKSNNYVNRIQDMVANLAADKGFSKAGTVQVSANNVTGVEDEGSSSDLKKFQGNFISKTALKFSDDQGNSKVLLIQGRGNPAWVPKIEANELDSKEMINSKPMNTASAMAEASREAANQVKISPEQNAGFSDKIDLNEAFKKAPDIGMLCCTHYPAMKDTLSNGWGSDTNFIQQDEIVANMVKNMSSEKSGVIEDEPSLGPKLATQNRLKMDISLGQSSVSQERVDDVRKIISGIFPDVDRQIEVSGIGDQGLNEFKAIHRDIEFKRESGGGSSFTAVFNEANQRVKPGQESGPNDVNMMWKQDLAADTPHMRANAKLVGSIPVSTIVPEKHINNLQHNVSLLRDAGAEGPEIRDTLEKISDIGRLLTQGEKRGLDILASRSEPGISLFNAASRVALTIERNNQLEPGAGQKENIAIVTGFTVVDSHGNRVAGENDGPSGALIMAKQILDNGSPATIVLDTGSEASVYASAKALGLLTEGPEMANIPAKDKTFAANTGGSLAPNFTVQVVDHGPGTNTQPRNSVADITDSLARLNISEDDEPGTNTQPRNTVADITDSLARLNISEDDEPGTNTQPRNTVADVKDTLERLNTSLAVSIERPSESKSGELHSMSGVPINDYNVKMTDLFMDRVWESIGIGDGGNEIGTAGAKEATANFRKPDFTPVVNNGDKIAATTETDHMVLGSVSNNAGVGMAIASQMLLNTMHQSTAIDSSNTARPLPGDLAGTQGDASKVEPKSSGMARTIVENYKASIDRMFAEGISIDGVNKVNAQTVDGRPIHRPDNQNAQEVGTPGATHDDMFDQIVRIAER